MAYDIVLIRQFVAEPNMFGLDLDFSLEGLTGLGHDCLFSISGAERN